MDTQTMYKTRPAAPIPKAPDNLGDARWKGRSPHRIAADSLEVGQSFVLGPVSQKTRNMCGAIVIAAKASGKKFATRTEGGNLTVWRVK